MSEPAWCADGHGPEWAAAVADLADRAAAAFGRVGPIGPLTVIDLEPWRLLDAWWLRRRLEPLAHLAGRAVRYVPCAGPAAGPATHRARTAAAWSVGAAPLELRWPAGAAAPTCNASLQPWRPDGPVLVLAGELPRRLPQDLLLAHHGVIHDWRGSPPQWEPADLSRYDDWMARSAQAYAHGLPSAMLSLPVGYWRFLAQAVPWAAQGLVLLARAEGWSSLAEMREDAAQSASVRSDSPPVNFHWLSQQLPRLGAAVHGVRSCRGDAVQLAATGLPQAETVLAMLGAPLAAATTAARDGRTRAVRRLAEGGDLAAALGLLQGSQDDPALLRGAWESLARAAAAGPRAATAPLGAWLARVMADNPWIGDDAGLLRAAGHVALACSAPGLAHTALRALDELGRALPSDLAALARSLEQLGRLPDALAACQRALSRGPGDEALAAQQRLTQRLEAMSVPWRVPHGHPGSPLLLDPLHADHAPMLAWQLRDPSVASMTALAPLEPGDDGRGWIRTRLADGTAVFALMHRQLGFVGYLDLRVWDTTAFLCYWIGPDFQGLGLCAPAIALARELAFANGVRLLVSSAYDDNERSLRALRRSGFRVLPVRAQAPDHDRTFVMLPAAPMAEQEALERLIDFCDKTGSGLRFGTGIGTAAPDAAGRT